jgi:hypothetical protein
MSIQITRVKLVLKDEKYLGDTLCIFQKKYSAEESATFSDDKAIYITVEKTCSLEKSPMLFLTLMAHVQKESGTIFDNIDWVLTDVETNPPFY